jgi:hypothetical protein
MRHFPQGHGKYRSTVYAVGAFSKTRVLHSVTMVAIAVIVSGYRSYSVFVVVANCNFLVPQKQNSPLRVSGCGLKDMVIPQRVYSLNWRTSRCSSSALPFSCAAAVADS